MLLGLNSKDRPVISGRGSCGYTDYNTKIVLQNGVVGFETSLRWLVVVL